MLHIKSKLPTIAVNAYYCFEPVNDIKASVTFLCLLNGSLVFEMAGRKLSLWIEDIIFIPSETAYTLTPTDSCLILCIEFHPYFLAEALGMDYLNINFCSLDYSKEDAQKSANYIANLATTYINGHDNNECQILSRAYDLIHHISSHYIKNSIPSELTRSERKIFQYEQFIRKNFQRQISLSDVSDVLGYTPQYLADFFLKN